jgi:hypothetical protein
MVLLTTDEPLRSEGLLLPEGLVLPLQLSPRR